MKYIYDEFSYQPLNIYQSVFLFTLFNEIFTLNGMLISHNHFNNLIVVAEVNLSHDSFPISFMGYQNYHYF